MELLAQAADAGGGSDTAEVVAFWVFSVIGIGTGIAMITMRNIVHAALMLVVNFFAIAGLFLALQSQFLSIIQIIVYAGAIMVLFLFVIMLLGVDRDDLLLERRSGTRIAAYAVATLVAGALVFAFVGPFTGDASVCGAPPAANLLEVDLDAIPCAGLDDTIEATDDGSVGFIARSMFTRFTFPFEAASLLLVVATIGAIVLGRRHDVATEDDPAYATDAPRPGAADVERLVAGHDAEAATSGELPGEER